MSAADAACEAALELCAIAAPTFQEERRAVEVARRFEAMGLPVTRDGAGNVLVRYGGDGPAVVFAAHLDTVFPVETPLRPSRDGDVLRGPGIGDNCLGLAGLLHLGELCAAMAPAVPEGPIVLAATVGEEGLGDLRGARAVVEGIECAAFVAIEGHGIDDLHAAGVGSVRYRATYRGPGGHSWADRGTPSALHELFDRARDAIDAAPPATVNVGVAHGGTSVNTIAAEASLEIDLRSEDAGVLRAAAARVREALATPRSPLVDAEIELVGDRPAGATAPDHPLVEAVRDARARVGLPPAAEVPSSTDANAALGAGIPAVTVGLSRGGNVHRPDEWIAAEPVVDGLRMLELVALAAMRGLPE
jgi:acetylornithine deacetylase/succinyl-diaminopimelate desuccinylase-like protein